MLNAGELASFETRRAAYKPQPAHLRPATTASVNTHHISTLSLVCTGAETCEDRRHVATALSPEQSCHTRATQSCRYAEQAMNIPVYTL